MKPYILQHTYQCPILAILTQVGIVRHGFHLIPLNFRILGKKTTWYSGKKNLDPDWTEIFIPDPTWKYSQKIPDWFRSGPVRSGKTRVVGLPRRSLFGKLSACFDEKKFWMFTSMRIITRTDSVILVTFCLLVLFVCLFVFTLWLGGCLDQSNSKITPSIV